MVVQAIETLWKGAKFTTQSIVGLTKVAFSPNDPIPQTKMHPRMPPSMNTPGEIIRMYSWRHNWRVLPGIRHLMIITPAVIWFLFYYIPSGPRNEELFENAHHQLMTGEHMYRHARQKDQDSKYFEKYDPLRNVRKEIVEYKL